MGTVAQHVEQWKHNRRFATTVDATFRDWQVTAVFYTALHAVDAALAHLGIAVSSHEQRNSFVKSNASLTPVRNAYLHLHRLSLVTRYDTEPDKWLPREFQHVEELAAAWLRPIERHVKELIGLKEAWPDQSLTLAK